MGGYSGKPAYPTRYTRTPTVGADAQSSGKAGGVEVLRQFQNEVKSFPSVKSLSPILVNLGDPRAKFPDGSFGLSYNPVEHAIECPLPLPSGGRNRSIADLHFERP